MDKYADYLKKKHFPIKKGIFEKEYKEYKAKLSEEEFKARFYRIEGNEDNLDVPTYYRIIADNPTEHELTSFLLDELLTQQKITARKTNIIAGILIFWLVCSFISGIYIAVTLSKLF